jgi:uncharacterized membrane protein
MRATLAVHILAGTLAVLLGFVALYAAKGGTLHRRSGMLFVYLMVAMATLGMVITIVRGVAPVANIPAGLLTITLVVTALTTVRPEAGARWLSIGAMLVLLAVGLASLTFGARALANGGRLDGIPAFPLFMFGVVGLLAAAGDLRVLRSGARRGGARLARHLWRMCFALFIASLSFTGQLPKRFIPKQYHFPVLFSLPTLAVLVTMLYWLWRVRSRRAFRGITIAGAPGVRRGTPGHDARVDAAAPSGSQLLSS